MNDNQPLILVESYSNGVAKLTLNNPPLNLVTLRLTQELEEALERLDTDDDVRCVVIAGAGERAFCAGSNIKEFPHLKDRFVEKKSRRENLAFSRIEYLSKPVIAAIDAVAAGGGAEIAIACDIRIMAENAEIGFPEILIGVFPGSGGLFRLPRLVGQSKAVELMYLGHFISAREAERIGLVNRVVPSGQALPEALALAEKIASQPRQAIKAIKKGVSESLLLRHDEAVALTLEMNEEILKTADSEEGVRAFLEKQKPRFHHT